MTQTAQSGKVQRVVLYTCRDYAIPSRDNDTEDHPREVFDGNDHNFVMNALRVFATCPERCKLVLELDNGREIGFIPVLQESSPAMGESDHTIHSPVKWDLDVEVWPK